MYIGRLAIAAGAFGLALAAAAPSAAQTPSAGTAVGGYASVADLTSSQLPGVTFDTGWLAAATVRIGSSRWSGTGEVGSSWHTTTFDEKQELFLVVGGGRFDIIRSARWAVFAIAQAGMERFAEPGFSEWGFAFQPGGGIDMRLWSRIIARAQGDYRMVQAGGSTYHRVRFVAAAGVTF
jgi:hypothetical protein